MTQPKTKKQTLLYLMSKSKLIRHLSQVVILQIQRAQVFHLDNLGAIDLPNLVAIDEEVLQNRQLIDAFGELGKPVFG